MNDKDLEALFDAADDIEAGRERRQQAIDAALDAYDTALNEQLSQGTDESDRPTPDIPEISRSKNMSATSQRLVYSGLATAAVMVLSVTLFLNMQSELEPVPTDFTEAVIDPRERLVPVPGKKAELEEFEAGESGATYGLKRDTAELRGIREGTRRALGLTDTNEADVFAKAAPARLEEIVVTANAVPMYEEQFSVDYIETGRDRFQNIVTNPVKLTTEEAVSTFSIDVDTASYSFVRRQLNQGVLPQKDAVRLEEMVNYFPYDYVQPSQASEPFVANVSVIDSPWRAGNKLIHIGIKGYELDASAQPRSNLVFLLDVSGSMNSPDKLPLVKQSMGLLLDQLREDDTVAIVVYAGAAGTVLEPTPVKERRKIIDALQRLNAGGSTAGAAGIKLAYQLAESNFVEDGVNRIILATDGDFNVGITNREELQGFVERKRESGIFLSVLGFGQGNYYDHMMQVLAQNGNGVAAYIDTLSEAQKVLVDEATSTLFPIAKDVKIQVEFNPATVKEYRLLGYETRLLNREDFNNDAVDAGEIGSGHTVTAIYEITPTGHGGLIDESRYATRDMQANKRSSEYGFVKIRYKLPEASTSKLISQVIQVDQPPAERLRQEVNFAVAIAGFAQLLKDAKYTGEWNYEDALELARANKGQDPYGYRAELTQLIRKAQIADTMQ